MAGAASIATLATLEVATAHIPLCTTPRNSVAVISGPVLRGLSVEAMSLTVVQLSVENCHFTITPLWPLNPMVVPLPLQTTDRAGLAVPPTDAAFTVTLTLPVTVL